MPPKNERGKNESATYSAERDPQFVALLLRSLAKDKEFFTRAAPLLPSDFFEPPAKPNPVLYAHWIIADICKEYYASNRTVIGDMLPVHVKRFIKRNNVNELRAETLTDVAAKLVKKKPVDRQTLLRELHAFTEARMVSSTVSELVREYDTGALTLPRLREIYAATNQAGTIGQTGELPDYFAADGFKRRQLQRKLQPFKGIGTGLFEIDAHMSRIGPGHVCIVLAPLKRGKTMMLQQIAIHSVFYGHNAGFATFEMPKADLLERFDCYTTGMTADEIAMRPHRAHKRYATYSEKVKSAGGNLYVVDADEIGGNTIAHLEAFIERCRAQGTSLNSMYVDYDEFVFPNVKVKDNPVERYNLLYLEFKRLAQQYGLVFWTAAQTQRSTSLHKVLSMDHGAQDQGKIRKADFVLGIGNGEEYHDNAVYAHIVANRHGAAGFGMYCITDYARAMIYDRETTAKVLRESPLDDDELAA